jgi:hypothetical protein
MLSSAQIWLLAILLSIINAFPLHRRLLENRLWGVQSLRRTLGWMIFVCQFVGQGIHMYRYVLIANNSANMGWALGGQILSTFRLIIQLISSLLAGFYAIGTCWVLYQVWRH